MPIYKRSRGPDPIANFLELAADPARFQAAKDELDQRKAAAELAEDAARRREAAVGVREAKVADLEKTWTGRVAAAEGREAELARLTRQQAEQAETVSRRSLVLDERERAVAAQHADISRLADDALRAVRQLVSINVKG